MEMEYVIRDASKLGDVEQTIRSADNLLKVLLETAEQMGSQHSELADIVDAVADILQAAVLHHTGVDIRRVGAAPTDQEVGELAVRAIQRNLSHPASDQDHPTASQQSRQQLLATIVEAYRQQQRCGNSSACAQLLDQLFGAVEGITLHSGPIDNVAA